MRFKEEEIIELLKLKSSGNRGWYLGECPYCGKAEHLGVIFGVFTSSFTCKKCGEYGGLYKLLLKIDRLDLLFHTKKTATPNQIIEKLNFSNSKENLNYSNLPKKLKPLGFKRIKSNIYLESRGFTKEQFEIFEVGISSFDPFISNSYIAFIINENNRTIGWVARSIHSKQWIDEFNAKAKLKGENKYLRWINSLDTDFSKILYGFEEITQDTKVVILVEGLTSKFNVDRLLNLYQTPLIKCCASFGKKLSDYQIKRLIDKNIDNVILLFDPDAIKETKQYSFELEKYFNTEVGFIPDNKDPGDLSLEEITNVFVNLESPIEFNTSKIINKLK